jgi:hypothetical protein
LVIPSPSRWLVEQALPTAWVRPEGWWHRGQMERGEVRVPVCLCSVIICLGGSVQEGTVLYCCAQHMCSEVSLLPTLLLSFPQAASQNTPFHLKNKGCCWWPGLQYAHQMSAFYCNHCPPHEARSALLTNTSQMTLEGPPSLLALFITHQEGSSRPTACLPAPSPRQ